MPATKKPPLGSKPVFTHRGVGIFPVFRRIGAFDSVLCRFHYGIGADRRLKRRIGIFDVRDFEKTGGHEAVLKRAIDAALDGEAGNAAVQQLRAILK